MEQHKNTSTNKQQIENDQIDAAVKEESIDNSESLSQLTSIKISTSTRPKKLNFCCPYCGSEQVEKSIGGKLEHAAALGATKLAKSYFLGNHGRLTRGAENKIINDEVPFQQVCNYCHRTFHARKSQIESGKYSMLASEAAKLMNDYNSKLQIQKDIDVWKMREIAGKMKIRAIIAAALYCLGLIIFLSCERTTTGFLGMQETTGSFMFSCVLMFWGWAGALFEGFRSYSKYKEANNVENMNIQQYAKGHKYFYGILKTIHNTQGDSPHDLLICQ